MCKTEAGEKSFASYMLVFGLARELWDCQNSKNYMYDLEIYF